MATAPSSFLLHTDTQDEKSSGATESTEPSNTSLFQHYHPFLDVISLCAMSCVCKQLRLESSHESLWKPLCLARWPELEHATQIENDDFPAWKSCYGRKAKDGETSLSDLSSILGYCAWYQCPNGHLYVIGECRMPMETGRCPECGESIGGMHHRMLNTNDRLGVVSNMANATQAKSITFGGISDSVHQIANGSPIDSIHRPGLITMNEVDQWEDRYGSRRKRSQPRVVPPPVGARKIPDMFKMDSSSDDDEDDDDEPPEFFICPLSHEIYCDPVVTPNGQVYEREFIVEWLKENSTDPNTGAELRVEDLRDEVETRLATARWLGVHPRYRAKLADKLDKKENEQEPEPEGDGEEHVVDEDGDVVIV